MPAQRQMALQVFSQLQRGEFIFDDFAMTPDAVARMRQVQLRAAYPSADGTDNLLWVTSVVDEKTRSIEVITWEDHFTAEGRPEWRRYRRLELSWLDPDHARMLLLGAGFTIDACHRQLRRGRAVLDGAAPRPTRSGSPASRAGSLRRRKARTLGGLVGRAAMLGGTCECSVCREAT